MSKQDRSGISKEKIEMMTRNRLHDDDDGEGSRFSSLLRFPRFFFDSAFTQLLYRSMVILFGAWRADRRQIMVIECVGDSEQLEHCSQQSQASPAIARACLSALVVGVQAVLSPSSSSTKTFIKQHKMPHPAQTTHVSLVLFLSVYLVESLHARIKDRDGQERCYEMMQGAY